MTVLPGLSPRASALMWIGLAVLIVVVFGLNAPGVISRSINSAVNPTFAGLKVGPLRCTEIQTTDQDPSVKEECGRLTTYASQLLDQEPHAPVALVEVYQEPHFDPYINTYGGLHDSAIVTFRLSDGQKRAFFINCGAGATKTLCWDLRPRQPGDTKNKKLSRPNPVTVP